MHDPDRHDTTVADRAVASARAAVGLYGDPTITWFIGLDVTLAEPVDAHLLRTRAASLLALHPLLGADVEWSAFDEDTADETMDGLLNRPLQDGGPVLRVATAAAGRRLLVVAHHGATDGFGLLAVLGALLGSQVTSRSRGIGSRSSSVSFLRGAGRRLGEAIWSPPARLAAGRAATLAGHGDLHARVDQPAVSAGTGRLVEGAVHAVVGWNEARASTAQRIAVAVAASRRDGGSVQPDRETAYLRLRLGPRPAGIARGAFDEVLRHAAPEPTFPAHSVRAWSRGAGRVLRHRLGSTLLVSNLGRLDGGALESVAFYPAAAGPRALAVGLASTATTTTVTVRLPLADFTRGDAAALCVAIARHLS